MQIRKDDQVEVIAGDDGGNPKERKIAKVLRVIPERNKIVVEGVNRVYKHLRPSQKNPQGGRLSKEMPIDVSNVLLYCSKCSRGVRIGRRFTDEGQKQRYCKSCGTNLGNIGPRKPAHAAKARAAAKSSSTG
jgi:large subunit ribosomal protein L24